MVGWLGQLLTVIMELLPNSFRILYGKAEGKKELKATIIALQLESLQKQKYDSENKSKPTQSSFYLSPDNFRNGLKATGGSLRHPFR